MVAIAKVLSNCIHVDFEITGLTIDVWIIEWLLLHQFSKFAAISWREQVNFQWDDDEVRFVLDQHTELDFYSASSLKKQSAGRQVAPLGHIIPIPSQPMWFLIIEDSSLKTSNWEI